MKHTVLLLPTLLISLSSLASGPCTSTFRYVDTLQDINQRDTFGRTPLMNLCLTVGFKEKDIIDNAKDLIEAGADINAQDNQGDTILHLLTRVDMPKYAQFLLENGANANIYNNVERRPIDEPSVPSKKYQSLLEQYSNPPKSLYKDAMTIRDKSYASSDNNSSSDYSYDESLVTDDFGLNNKFSFINFKNACGYTRRISHVLCNNEDVNQVDEEGQSPIHWSSLECSFNDILAKEVIRRGANINAQDNKGNTALHYTARQKGKGRKRLAKLLLKHNIDTTIQNNNGKTALDIAQDKKNKQFARLLIDQW